MHKLWRNPFQTKVSAFEQARENWKVHPGDSAPTSILYIFSEFNCTLQVKISFKRWMPLRNYAWRRFTWNLHDSRLLSTRSVTTKPNLNIGSCCYFWTRGQRRHHFDLAHICHNECFSTLIELAWEETEGQSRTNLGAQTRIAWLKCKLNIFHVSILCLIKRLQSEPKRLL